MDEQIEREQFEQAQRRQRQVLTEAERYRALIKGTINQYLYNDGSFNGKSCLLNLKFAFSGLVTQVEIIRGDPALCRASRAAALRPDKVPMTDDLDVYQELKEMELWVNL